MLLSQVIRPLSNLGPSPCHPLDLSICLVNWNTKDMLRDCINSILATTVDLKYEIFVIDNASSDGSVEMMQQEFPDIFLRSNEVNAGFSSANNQGIELARGRNILLLNPDTIVLNGALKKLSDFLDNTPTAGAVAPRLLNTDGTLQYSIRKFPTLLTPFTENTILMRTPLMKSYAFESRLGSWGHKNLREVEQPAGAAFMLKRPVIETLGLLDSNYHMFFEDVDLCYRIRMNGWQIFYYPDAQIIHHAGQSVKKRHNIGEEFYKSLRRYFRVHYGLKGEIKVRSSMIIGSSVFFLYASFLALYRPAAAFEVAKTAFSVMRCGVKSYS